VQSLKLPWVEILRRPGKAGLGAAYRAGFAHVLPLGKYSKIVTMDADGSHRVADLPAMLDDTDDKLSTTLGTRWMPGGTVVNWPKSRQLVSESRAKYARLTLTYKTTDATGGFRVINPAIMKNLTLNRLISPDS